MEKSPRKPAKDRKQEIVETAIRLAGELGPDRLTTQHVADAIGISQPAIFRHFRTKGEIWLAVAEHISDFMQTNSPPADADGQHGAEKLQEMVTGHLAFIQRTPAVPAILFSQELHAENRALRDFFADLIARNQGLFANVIRQDIQSGRFRADLGADDAAYLVLALIQGLAMRWSLNGRDFDLVAEGGRLLDVQVQAFYAPSPHRKKM